MSNEQKYDHQKRLCFELQKQLSEEKTKAARFESLYNNYRT